MTPTDAPVRRAAVAGLLAAAAVTLVLGATACGSEAASGAEREPSSSAPVPSAASPGTGDVATELDRLGRERFPEHYAGLEMLGGRADGLTDGRIAVYRTPSAAFDEAVRELAPDAVLRDAPHSAVELQALTDRIVADIGYWEGQQIPITSVGPRHDGTAVEVGTTEAERAGTALPERYDPTPPIVVLEQGPFVPLSGQRVRSTFTIVIESGPASMPVSTKPSRR